MVDLVVTGAGTVAPEAGWPLDGSAGAWFDVRGRLGPRGYKYLPPAAQYLLAAAREAGAGARFELVPAERRAAVVGSNCALSTFFDETDKIVRHGHADRISPAVAPYFAVNVLSGRLSAENALHAFTLTVTSPRIAGLEAVEVGSRAVAAGRCDGFLAAAMEYGTPALSGTVAAEQGAVVLVIQPYPTALAQRIRPLGRLRVRTLFLPPGLVEHTDLAGRFARVLDELGVSASAPVYPVLDQSPVAETALAALAAARGGATGIAPTERAGGGCLGPMRRAATLLGPPAAEAVVLAATGEGQVALAGLSPVAGPDRAGATTMEARDAGAHDDLTLRSQL